MSVYGKDPVLAKKILLTGGGTAGHIMPNIALLDEITGKGYDAFYVCSKVELEKKIVGDAGLRYYTISSGKLRRYFSFKNFTDPFKILRGYFQSRKVIKREKPDIVFSKGGFVSVPVVYAAHSKKVPIVIHESDYTPGLANRLCVKKAKRVCVSFEAAAKHIPASKCVVTGSPVREELASGDRQRGLEFLGFDGEKPVILVMGGSQGAQAVNEAVDLASDALLENFDIAHVRGAGKLNVNMQKTGYRQFEYISGELADVFAATDMMVTRAGANTIFELLYLSIPALLIPLPLEASRGDQILNAKYFETSGYSIVLEQAELTPVTLANKLSELSAKKTTLRTNMINSAISNGTKNVAEVIFSVVEGK